ncbi:hypothetical protein [Myroides odoratimimus]|uniref:hypothetical protein n=1 Tax=Myroides odoratimimus TaxID=76832 RepID=UPI00310157B1
MKHNILHPYLKQDIDYNPFNEESESISTIPKKSNEKISQMIESGEYNVLINYNNNGQNSMVLGFPYFSEKKLVAIPFIEPTTIFFSNAVLSMGNIEYYKEKLIKYFGSKENKGNLNHMQEFFTLSFNCIVSLQTALESFLNKKIPQDYVYYHRNGNEKKHPSIKDKINFGMVNSYNKNFEESFNLEYNLVIKLIDLRNRLIHSDPNEISHIYKEMFNFLYSETIAAIKSYINFYEKNLIQDCSCDADFRFDIIDYN